jgi:hypothetical protein
MGTSKVGGAAAVIVVLVAMLGMAGSAQAADYSSTCDTPLVEGWLLQNMENVTPPTQVMVRTLRPDSSHLSICMRVQHGPGAEVGGRLDIGMPNVSVYQVGTDDQSGLCASTAGNLVPGAHPSLLADQGNPGTSSYTHLLVDEYVGNGEVWVCAEATANGVSTQKRYVFRLPNATPPSVDFKPDSGPVYQGTPSDSPAGYPSYTCRASQNENNFVNLDSPVAHVWLYDAHPAESQWLLCARVTAPVSAGLLLAVDTGAPSVGPGVAVASDETGCDLNVLTLGTPAGTVKLSRSSAASLPASVCVTTNAGTTRATVTGPSVSGLPSVTLTPDT